MPSSSLETVVMESKPLHEERYVGTLAERCWPTVRGMVTPPSGSEVKAGANWKHIVWNLQQTGMPRKQADAVVRRLMSDRKLTARKYGRAYVLFECKTEGRTYGPPRLLGKSGMAALR
jgi:hypothetical protein